MNRLYNKIKYLNLLAILIAIPFHFTVSQNNVKQEIEKQFENALIQFNSGNYNQAISSFNKIITEYDYNSKTTISEFFKAKILLQLERLEEFKTVADGFLEKYPSSNYIEEIRLLLTKYYLAIANYYNAFREALFIIEKTNSSTYEINARKIGEGIAAKYLNDSQLQKLYSLFTSNKVKSFVLLQLGKYFIRSGDSYFAKSNFSDLMKNYPESVEYDQANKLHDFSYESGPVVSLIGVMLPLETNSTGEFTSQPASEILEGIKFAVNEFNQSRSDKIGLIIRDTKKDTEEIKKIREEFTSLNSLIAILGPIFSNEVRATLEEFDDYDIPIISPTATDDDLTSLNQNFFQANPSFSTRGKVMAQYIFYVENKRAVSVINSINGYSPLLAANFAEEFERLGGTVLRRETIKDTTTDFSLPLSNIYSDSLTTQGIYIPLSDNSVTPYIFSELIKFYTKIPMYGNQDWFTARGFETAPEISNNLIFTSDYFVDFNTDDYYNFNDQFISVTGKDVNRNALYGYDAAKFVLTALRNSEFGRENLKTKMISGMISSGMHNNISFDEKRVNRFLNIVRYKDGVFELVDKFRLSQ
ncbi:MAG: ABC transporter substrate-binding protein [Ignavibacteriaceae bacterium]